MAVVINQDPVARFIKYWLPVIVYAILIFHVSATPGEEIPSLFPKQDIVAHLLEYFIFGLLINRAIKSYFPGNSFGMRFFWVSFIGIAYGASDEFHQMFVPNRYCSSVDLLSDSLGVFIATFVYTDMKKFFLKHIPVPHNN
ncbi:MAG: VanZ family protein [Candidatus Omnitrophota bacterium]|jgi:VanZ family protein